MTRRLLIPTVLLALTLVGCSDSGDSGDGDDADPPAVTPGSAAPLDPRQAIPPIGDPRDLAGVAGEPCALLTPEQVAAVGITGPGERYPQPGFPDVFGCDWKDREPGFNRKINLFTNIGYDGIRTAYERFRGGPGFELTEIGGHPAIVTKDAPDTYDCRVGVAAAENQSFTVSFGARDFSVEACGVSKDLARQILAGLTPAGG